MGDTARVIAALENPNYEWRTIDGISKETGLSPERVKEILTATAEQIIHSSVPDEQGRPLYTTRRHYRNKTGLLKRSISVLADRIK